MAEQAGDAETEADRSVRADDAKRVRADESEECRKPQGAQDESDEAAEEPDQHSREDRRPRAELPRVAVSCTLLRPEEIDPEDEKCHADRDEQSVARHRTREQTSDGRAGHRRWCHPDEKP